MNPIISKMYNNDPFSQWMGIERLAEAEGYCKLRMVIRPEMCNGFGLCHGGITFSFADSCLAFASNSRGKQAVSIETSISHTTPLLTGESIIAESKEMNITQHTCLYYITLTKESTGDTVALFKGICYRKNKDWEV
ncbi:MAG TPA: hotdog fold thioesterase [Chitinophagaceae bacterium]|nr:hotdog fold thioesterase [Chitinophagaceae bacterium]